MICLSPIRPLLLAVTAFVVSSTASLVEAGHNRNGGDLSLAASGSAVLVGQRVVAASAIEVRALASASSRLVGRHAPGKLGLVTAGPTNAGGTQWWRVDFEGGADGWTSAASVTLPYFPAAESRGGWRSLVPYVGTPAAAQKATLRAKTGIDWDRLKTAYDYSRSFTSSTSVLVIRNGYVAGEWGSRAAYGVASVSKSLAGLAVAKLFDLSASGSLPRAFGPDLEAYRFLPQSWTAGAENKKSIRIRHLMTMTSGLQPHDRPGTTNYLSVMLGLPAQASPGTRWAYASAPVDLLSIAAQSASGFDLAGTFNRQIAAKIGAANFAWGKIDAYTGASSRASATPRDLARVGYLSMMDGRWDGGGGQQALVTPARVRALRTDCGCASSVYEPTPGSPFLIPVDSPEQYGQLWWSNRTGSALGAGVPRDAFYAHGYRETLLVVVPSLNLVAVRFGPYPRSLPEFRREFMARVMAAVGTPTAI